MFYLKLLLILNSLLTLSDFGPTSDPASLEQVINQTEQVQELDYSTLIADYQPNELGQIMIVMYHNLVSEEKKEGYYARTPENFKKDIIRLHLEGYVPISMSELIEGSFTIEAGKTPIVLTFDDGSPSNFNYLEDGSLDPNSVIGIFEEIEKEYPDFKAKAIFYINQPVVFGNAPMNKDKLTYLMKEGYELGNHTANHAKLTELSNQAQRDTIFKQAVFLEELTGNKGFHFSVPFGKKPEGYFDLVKSEDWLYPYRMRSSVNVGWNPVVSPYDIRFDAYNLNRITVGEDDYELSYWLDYFLANPSKRFRSDGIEELLTIKEEDREFLKDDLIQGKKLLIYQEGGLIWNLN